MLSINIMNFELTEQNSEITDGLEDVDGWACVSSGDIYLDDNPFGYYVAAWYPNMVRDLKIMVSVVNEKSECFLTIGAVCKVGSLNDLEPVDPHELPWGEGVPFSSFTKPEEYKNFTRAQLAFDAAKFVIEHNEDIRKYLSENA